MGLRLLPIVMMISRFIRYFLFLALALLALVLLLFGLFFVDTALSLYQRLHSLPGWMVIAIASFIFLLTLPVGWLLYRLLRPSPPSEPAAEAPPNREQLEERLEQARQAGAETEAIERELAQLQQRKAAGTLYVALFGEVSSGKSSLVRALLPSSEATVGVVGGTTRELHHYAWHSPAGDQLILVDMPGLQEAGGDLDALAIDEALRSHLVIYLCEGDLTRTQFQEIRTLGELNKPLIVAINKIDRFAAKDLEQIRQRVAERLEGLNHLHLQIVPLTTGGRREVIVIDPDGNEQREMRPLPPQVDGLREAIQRVVDSDPEVLEQLRDSAVFVLAARQLDRAISEQRRKRAEEIVDSYSKKAVIGAIAAVAPGSDLIIQGALATLMVRELCKLYEVPVRQVDLDRFLQLVQSKARSATALILAIAGNAFKAFPGTGTLVGGAMHAVAYGIIFDALGKSVSASLESRGELRPQQAATQFKELMSENLDVSAKRFARLAFEEIKRAGRRSP